ncbi:MAG: response regulator transcription factor [Chloroflexota bacterium]|nr:response regulator transcription factor [Chloroflexota bacterium]
MRLLICHDNRLVLDALSKALSDNGHTVVATALDRHEAVDAAREHHPDVCLLDVDFRRGNALSAIDRIHEMSPNTKLVVLSGSISRDLVAAGAIAQPAQGAPGLVGNEPSVAPLVVASPMARQGHLKVDVPSGRDVLPPQSQHDDVLRALKFLTEREWEALRCIMHGLSTDDMAVELGVHVSTARTHVQNLLRKFGVHSRLQVAALITAHASEKTWSRLGISGLTAPADDDPVAEAVHLGVRDWVVKQSGIEALLAAVREAAGGQAHLSAALLTRDLASLSDQAPSPTPESEAISLLTARELDVLHCLSDGLSGSQIGVLLHVSPNTIRTHRGHILHKLKVHSTLTAVALARRAGVDGLGGDEVTDPREGSGARQSKSGSRL